MKKKLTMLFVVLLLHVGAVLAQTRISGVVVADADNEPVIGVTVTVVGTKIATVTDVDGKFSLSVQEAHPQITVSYIGMVSQTLKGSANMKISMKADAQVINEVVVTGLTRTDR